MPCENSTNKFNSSFLEWLDGGFLFFSDIYLCVCVCGHLCLFCSGKFRLYSTVSSAIVTILYIRSSDFILQRKVFILYTNLSPFHPTPLPLSPWKLFPQPIQFSRSSCLTLCDPMNHSTPGLPVHHQLLEFTQTHVHQVSDAIQPSHPLSSPSPPAPNPFQHQGLFQ